MYRLILLFVFALFSSGCQAVEKVPDYIVPAGGNLEIRIPECNTWTWYHNNVQLEGKLLVSPDF